MSDLKLKLQKFPIVELPKPYGECIPVASLFEAMRIIAAVDKTHDEAMCKLEETIREGKTVVRKIVENENNLKMIKSDETKK